MGTKNLAKAKKAKNDEFYTQYIDIEKEINAYIDYNPDIFKGKTLLRKGLVNHMIPRPDLENFTHSYAQKITQNAPLSLKGIKKIIAMFEKDMALPSSNLQEADQIMQQCFQSDDLKEGQIAFMEKRVPKFTGK